MVDGEMVDAEMLVDVLYLRGTQVPRRIVDDDLGFMHLGVESLYSVAGQEFGGAVEGSLEGIPFAVVPFQDAVDGARLVALHLEVVVHFHSAHREEGQLCNHVDGVRFRVVVSFEPYRFRNLHGDVEEGVEPVAFRYGKVHVGNLEIVALGDGAIGKVARQGNSSPFVGGFCVDGQVVKVVVGLARLHVEIC